MISVSQPMRPGFISVIVSTYNRATVLRDCLDALRRQTWRDFEVIVVVGPCTDETMNVLAPYLRSIKCIHTPERNLSKSRNLGVEAAAGDIVAFIDDDSCAHPSWLADLAAAYDDPGIGGAGGLVYDHTGGSLQYRYSACWRNGQAFFDVRPPFDDFTKPGANPFLYLQGTNASFRRAVVLEVGGFNEEIEYYHDETELCLRIIDAGYRLKPLTDAIVYHRYAASSVRDVRRVVFDPYTTVKNHHLFVLQNGGLRYPSCEIYASLYDWTSGVTSHGHFAFANGDFTRKQADHFISRVEEGVFTGQMAALAPRPLRSFPPPATPLPFAAFPVEGRMVVCMLTDEYPPGSYGGIGRYTQDLATEMAALGHEIHVITTSPDRTRVDYEDGVWVHRRAAESIHPLFAQIPLCHTFEIASRLFAEVEHIRSLTRVDVVESPIWNCLGMVSHLSADYGSALTLMTNIATLRSLHKSWQDSVELLDREVIEGELFRSHQRIQGISGAVLEGSMKQYGAVGTGVVQWLGVQDPGPPAPRRENPVPVILFVGRLEYRKGVDRLVDAARRMHEAGLDFALRCIGRDTLNNELASGYFIAEFESRYAADPEFLRKISFLGEVSEADLAAEYAAADVFCLPSRYESFGLVILEAMARGVPAVVADMGGMVEIVTHEVEGLVFNSADELSLTRCLTRMVTDRKFRASAGRRARARFEADFTLQAAGERWIKGYRSLVPDRDKIERSPSLRELHARLVRFLSGTQLSYLQRPEILAWLALGPACRYRPFHEVLCAALDQPEVVFVDLVHFGLLKRAPDWEVRVRLSAGVSVCPDRYRYVRELMESDEFRTGAGIESIDAAATDGIWFEWEFRRLRNSGELDFVTMCYTLLLGRPPEPTLVERILRSATIIGDRIEFVAQTIDSPEFKARAMAPQIDIAKLRSFTDAPILH